jgi:NADPH:quinone reductase-like Zn-dependent oxidoreductase
VCRGLIRGNLGRGSGSEVAGAVDALGEGVAGVAAGDVVFGTADWANSASAGASEKAVMNRWFPVPDGLGPVRAAALPMTVVRRSG